VIPGGPGSCRAGWRRGSPGCGLDGGRKIFSKILRGDELRACRRAGAKIGDLAWPSGASTGRGPSGALAWPPSQSSQAPYDRFNSGRPRMGAEACYDLRPSCPRDGLGRASDSLHTTPGASSSTARHLRTTATPGFAHYPHPPGITESYASAYGLHGVGLRYSSHGTGGGVTAERSSTMHGGNSALTELIS
jgi:hypothetical protein